MSEVNSVLGDYIGVYTSFFKEKLEEGWTWNRLFDLSVQLDGQVLLDHKLLTNVNFSGDTLSWSFDSNSSAGKITFKLGDSDGTYWGKRGIKGKCFTGWIQRTPGTTLYFKGADFFRLYAGMYLMSTRYGAERGKWEDYYKITLFENGEVYQGDTLLKDIKVSDGVLTWNGNGNPSAGTLTFKPHDATPYYWGTMNIQYRCFVGGVQSGTGGPVDARGLDMFGAFAGNYKTSTKYGGMHGKWEAFGDLSITSEGTLSINQVVLNNIKLKNGNISWERKGNQTSGTINLKTHDEDPYFWSPGTGPNNCFTGGIIIGSGGAIDFKGLIENPKPKPAYEFRGGHYWLSGGLVATDGLEWPEHTYVCVDSNTSPCDRTNFQCYGGVTGWNNTFPAVESTGSLVLARTISCLNPEDVRKDYDRHLGGRLAFGDCSGIIYGITGVCHQMANRILFATRTTPQMKAGWWGVSYHLYGPYGRPIADTILKDQPGLDKLDWPKYIALCIQLAGGYAAEMEEEILDFEEALANIIRHAEDIGDIFAAKAIKLEHDEIGNPSLPNLRLNLMIEHMLGLNMAGNLMLSLGNIQDDFISTKKALEESLLKNTISGQEYALKMNSAHNQMLSQLRQILGDENYGKLTGLKSDQAYRLLDPEVAKKISYSEEIQKIKL